MTSYEQFIAEFAIDYDTRLDLDLIDFIAYGPNGIGKTPLVASCMEYEGTNKPFFLDLESGAQSAARMGIKVIDVQGHAAKHDLRLKKAVNDKKLDIYRALIGILDKLEGQERRCREEGIDFPYNVIILDGYTRLAEATMDYVTDSDSKHTTITPEIQHWGRMLVRVRSITNRLRQFPTHLIGTANEHTRKVGGVDLTGLDINPRTMNNILQNFGLVGRMKLVNGKVVISFKPLASVISRDRLGLMPAEMDKPSIKEIFNTYLTKKNE